MTTADPPSHPAPAPDSRNLQANERTLLAWMRTGISLITFGFVIARMGLQMAGDGREIPGAGWIGGLFVLLGALVEGVGIGRYALFHRSFVRGRPIPTGMTPVLIMAVAVGALGTLLGVFVVRSLYR